MCVEDGRRCRSRVGLFALIDVMVEVAAKLDGLRAGASAAKCLRVMCDLRATKGIFHDLRLTDDFARHLLSCLRFKGSRAEFSFRKLTFS